MGWFSTKMQPAAATDEELLQAYRNSGNLTLLGKLYEPYMPLIYGVCFKYLQNEEQSKDAVMQIFEELIDKARRHEVKQFRGWLYVLARNHCLMQLRAGKKNLLRDADDLMESELFLHQEDGTGREGEMQALERCMEKLPVTQQETLHLFFYRQQCYKDIAATTGYSLNEVKSFIQNGKRNLKICIQKSREQ